MLSGCQLFQTAGFPPAPGFGGAALQKGAVDMRARKTGTRMKAGFVALALAGMPLAVTASCDPLRGTLDVFRFDDHHDDFGFLDLFFIDDCFFHDCFWKEEVIFFD